MFEIIIGFFFEDKFVFIFFFFKSLILAPSERLRYA